MLLEIPEGSTAIKIIGELPDHVRIAFVQDSPKDDPEVTSVGTIDVVQEETDQTSEPQNEVSWREQHLAVIDTPPPDSAKLFKDAGKVQKAFGYLISTEDPHWEELAVAVYGKNHSKDWRAIQRFVLNMNERLLELGIKAKASAKVGNKIWLRRV